MTDSNCGTIKVDGNHTGPGGPLIVIPGGAGGGAASSVLLSLPPTLTDDLEGEGLRRLNLVQIEYARDVALLQSRAYDAILQFLVRKDSE